MKFSDARRRDAVYQQAPLPGHQQFPGEQAYIDRRYLLGLLDEAAGLLRRAKGNVMRDVDAIGDIQIGYKYGLWDELDAFLARLDKE
jgi:hypothetical protein